MQKNAKKQFKVLLMNWHLHHNTRQMPWKGEKNAYKIWLSEIILQQTRVEQGWSYYEKFIQQFPTIQDLASAEDQTVFKLWEGLGYYNRCKNLLFTARAITCQNNGVFPDTYESLLDLKGVGPYTAAAIASFAFNLPHAVVDGNVFRVLARVFGIATPTDSLPGKQQFTHLANEVIDTKNAAQFNQAIMDFGATVCKPFMPLCSLCALEKICIARAEGKVNLLPVKEKVLQKKNRFFSYFLFKYQGKILVNKRDGKDIWQSLFEFYLLECDELVLWDEKKVDNWIKQQFGNLQFELLDISAIQSQQLTHQKISGQFVKINLKSIPAVLKNYQWMDVTKINELAFPRFINQYLEAGFSQKNLV